MGIEQVAWQQILQFLQKAVPKIVKLLMEAFQSLFHTVCVMLVYADLLSGIVYSSHFCNYFLDQKMIVLRYLCINSIN